MRSLIFLLLFSSQAFAASIIGLGDLPGGFWNGTGIWSKSYGGVSNDGVRVTGNSESLSNGGAEAFIWSNQNSLTPLMGWNGNTGEYRSESRDMSTDGRYVVGSAMSNGKMKAARWSYGIIQNIGAPSHSSAHTITPDGSKVLGTIMTNGAYPIQTFLWDEVSGLNILPLINGTDLGLLGANISPSGEFIVGSYINSQRITQGFIWSNTSGYQELGDLPGGGIGSAARVVNDQGTVFGTSETQMGRELFKWTEENGIQGIGGLRGDSFHNIIYGNSVDGNLLLGVSESSSGHEAFIYTDDIGFLSFHDLILTHNVDIADWNELTPTDISEDGKFISGYGSRSDVPTTEAFLITLDNHLLAPAPVPLPAGIWFFLTGLLGLLGLTVKS